MFIFLIFIDIAVTIILNNAAWLLVGLALFFLRFMGVFDSE